MKELGLLTLMLFAGACQSGQNANLRRDLDNTRAALVAAQDAGKRQGEAYREAVARVGEEYRRGLREGAARVSCQRVLK